MLNSTYTIKMIDHGNANHRFPLPLLQVKGTTLPLEVVGGCGGAWNEVGVEALEPLATPIEVEDKVGCLLLAPTPTVGLCGGGGGIGCTRRSISSSTSVSIGSEPSSYSSSLSSFAVVASPKSST